MAGRARREYGEGSIYWSETHQRTVGELIVGKHPVTGRNILRTCRSPLKGRAGERAVEQMLDQIRAEIAAEAEAASHSIDPAVYTLWDCITDWHEWVPTTGKTSPWTADKLKRSCEIWLEDIAGTLLVDVDAAMLGEHMRLIAPNLGKAGLSDILSTIRRAIRHHMQRRKPLVARNVADDVDLPVAGKPAAEPTFLTREQVDLVFAMAKGSAAYALVTLGLQLGLRPGEIRALRWEHIDFAKRRVAIISYARRTGDGKTKTETSRRVLPIPGRAWEALQEHKTRWGGHEYVFTMEDGTQVTKDGLAWRVGQAFKEAGLPPYDPYTMRHTFASLADEAGMPHRKIADIMGHRDITTFQRVYRHKLRPEVTDADDELGGMWS